MSLALYKPPLMLVALVGLNYSTTPPNKPSDDTERVAVGRFEFLLGQKFVARCIKILGWSTALAEAAVILAQRYPAHPAAQWALAHLLWPGATPGAIGVTPAFLAGAALTLAGGLLRRASYRALGRLFTFELSVRKEHRLVTGGPYGVVRHPAYAGSVLTLAGMLAWQWTRGAWVRECGALDTPAGRVGLAAAGAFLVVVNAGLLARMRAEDAMMRKNFADEWDEWARRVPYMIIPGIW